MLQTRSPRRAPAPSASADDALGSAMQCGICMEILYKCVSVAPCMHSFCGACLSDWLKKSAERLFF